MALVTTKVELQHTRQADRALKKLPVHAKAEFQQVMSATAFQVSRKASLLAPRLTGRLRSAIDWQARPRSLSAVVGVRPDAYYWRFLEFGTRKMGARPFFRPAALAQESEHERQIQAAMKRVEGKVDRDAR